MKRKTSSGLGNEEMLSFNSKRRKIGTSMNISSKSRVALKNLSNIVENPNDEVKFLSKEKNNNFPDLNHYFQDNYFSNGSSRDLQAVKLEKYNEKLANNTSNTPFENIVGNSSYIKKQKQDKESTKKFTDKNLNSIFQLKKKVSIQIEEPKKELQKKFESEKIEYMLEDEYSRQPNKSKVVENDDKLLLLPEELRIIFSIDKFNSIQNKCFEKLYNTNNNIIISSPTGSGKTTLFEIAICKVINENLIKKKDNPNKNFKIIYLAPIKSLCQEKLSDWKQRFSKLNIGVTESTGDTDYINFPTIFTSNIILTTPEKFDSITRKWKEYSSFISNISLILIDEVHLLNDPTRGATLEAIVARMKLISLISKNQDKNLRFIALSATIPNINELAEWLNAEKDCLSFGEEYRPVKIEKVVLGYNMAKNEFLFEKYLDYRLADLIAKHSEGKPALVFCQTQKGTIGAAKQLCEDFYKLNYSFSENIQKQLIDISEKVKDKQLGGVLRHSIAFHNASLSPEDRFLVEDYYKRGLIKIICTTSTLAQGVNLPARLVIIKSTYCYRGQNVGYTEYSKIEIDQMMGRAGRPQYDTTGIAIIMTEKDNVDKFRDLTNNCQDIQSHLMTSLTEHINSEISLSTIIDLESSLNWIKNTFMYVRMRNEKGKSNPLNLDGRLEKICKEIFDNLKSIGLICYEDNYKNIKSKPLGKKMCKNCVAFDTMKIIVNINSNNEEIIFEEISKAIEFSKFRSKIEERKILVNLNKDNKIKYPIKGCIDTSAKKSFLLLQAALGNINIDQWELRREQSEILKYSLKIINCLKAFFKEKDNALGYEKTLILLKNLNQKMWNDSDMISRQLPKIGEKLAKQFVKVGLNTFEKIRNENPRKIESICGKNAPFGNILIDIIRSIPTLNLKHELIRNYKNHYKLQITITTQFIKYVNNEEFDPYSLFHLVVSRSNNSILLKAKIKPVINTKILNYFVNQISEDFFPINVRIICDKFVGMDQNYSVINTFNNDKGFKKPANAELIDDDLEKIIKDALFEHNSENIDLISSSNCTSSEIIPVEELNMKKATPKKLNRKEKKMKKEAEKCENIKDMFKNMKNLNTPINGPLSLTNKNSSNETHLQNTVSTNFSLDQSVLKDNLENKNIPQINKKINFLKEIDKIEKNEGKPNEKEKEDDYKLIIDLNEFF